MSVGQRGNMDQVRLAGICLPKPDVILDKMMICIGQSQNRVEGSIRNCWMRERVSPYKTSSICQNGLPDVIPLIPITRLLPSTTSNTRLPTHVRGLFYLTNYHIHGRKTTSSTPRLCQFAAARQGGIYRPRNNVHRTSAPTTKDSEKWQKAVKEKLPCVKTQYSRTVYPKEYANTVQPVTAQHSINSTTTYHLTLTESRLPENITKDPLSEFFLNKRTRIYAREL
jgi:hypothetical protein